MTIPTTPELASHMMHDYTQAQLDPQTRAMLDFAAKLTRTTPPR